jgi:homoserine dehydrogenase
MQSLTSHPPAPLPTVLTAAAPARDPFVSSGTSPTIHLIGAGKVGQALLRLIATTRYRVVAVTDRSATVYRRDGVDAAGVAAHKACGLPLSLHPDGGEIPLSLAVAEIGVSCVVDATATGPQTAEAARQRCLAVRRDGRRLVLAAKHGLLAGCDLLLDDRNLPHVGFNAVLGGTGLALKREITRIRTRCQGIACVPNATTSVVIDALASGNDLEGALACARRAGLLEADAELDLRGADARVKLELVASAVFGRKARLEGGQPSLHDLDPDLLRWRMQRRRATRLVGRGTPDGTVRLAFEELPLGSPLAVPGSRVAYLYDLGGGESRLHLGDGLGAEGTARALLADLDALFAGSTR